MAPTGPPADRPKPGYLSTPIIHPTTKATATAYVAWDKANHYLKYGPAHKFYELLYLVRETLIDDKNSCFPYNDDEFAGYLYTLHADYAMNNQGQRARPPLGKVFAVFLTGGLKVADWGWEVEDPQMPDRPAIHVERLEAPIWCQSR